MSEREIITGSPADFDWLPAGTVLRGHESGGDAGAVAVRTKSGWSFHSDTGRDPSQYPHIYGKTYEVLYRPAAEPPKVGDVIDTAEKAKLLPVGAVVVDDEESRVTSAPMVKVGDSQWLCWMELTGRARELTDYEFDKVPHRVIHIPASADAGTGSTAA